MNHDELWTHFIALDENLLKDEAILPWRRNFIAGEPDVASIIAVAANIDTYLQSEYSEIGKEIFIKLIDRTNIDHDLDNDLRAFWSGQRN